jgi:hypothetical protein
MGIDSIMQYAIDIRVLIVKHTKKSWKKPEQACDWIQNKVIWTHIYRQR